MAATGPVLGLDLGSRRIGLAVSDPEGRIAFPAGVMARQGREKDLAALRELVRERGASRIVVGLPIHMDGRSGPEAEAARAFSSALGEATGVPVELLDERWTTLEAERALRQTKQRGRKRRAELDTVAATILLRTWLERQRASTCPS